MHARGLWIISAVLLNMVSAVWAADSVPVVTDPNATAPNALPLKQIQRFTNAISEIKEYYVEPVADDKLFSQAIRGMVSGLDPHSSYLDAQDLKELQDVTQGEYEGIGVEVMMDDGLLRVVTPLDGSPGQKAGIKPGDIIARIDKAAVKGMTLREAISKLKGKRGTKVRLTIIRQDAPEPLKMYVTRQNIHVKSVRSKLLDQHYAYIRVSSFQSGTQADLRKIITDLTRDSKGQLKGLILDLRNNPGGLLDSAIEATNLFLDSKKLLYDRLIVYTKGRVTASQFQAKATSTDVSNGLPMVVLINAGSASGAEIMAGALQDQKRAVVLGTKSFGKGSVQTVLPIDNESALKLTTAIYYTPAGRSIQAKGIEPDVVVEDLKIPEDKKQSQSWLYLKESDLEGHLGKSGEEEEKEKNKDKNPKEKRAPLSSAEALQGLGSLPSPKEDYQLQAAVNLLQALAALKK